MMNNPNLLQSLANGTASPETYALFNNVMAAANGGAASASASPFATATATAAVPAVQRKASLNELLAKPLSAASMPAIIDAKLHESTYEASLSFLTELFYQLAEYESDAADKASMSMDDDDEGGDALGERLGVAAAVRRATLLHCRRRLLRAHELVAGDTTSARRDALRRMDGEHQFKFEREHLVWQCGSFDEHAKHFLAALLSSDALATGAEDDAEGEDLREAPDCTSSVVHAALALVAHKLRSKWSALRTASQQCAPAFSALRALFAEKSALEWLERRLRYEKSKNLNNNLNCFFFYLHYICFFFIIFLRTI